MTSINWGILGAGNISGQFVHDLILSNSRKDSLFTHIVRSVGSSSIDKGAEFARSHVPSRSDNGGVEPQIQSHLDLYSNDLVDVVYIGTPHPLHRRQALEAIAHGKHVLCEKPVTVTEASAQDLIDAARAKGVFFMEAVWTRFFPSIERLQNIIRSGDLGDVKRLVMDFTFDAEVTQLPPTSRVRDLKLAGGALLDIGVYNITYARILLDDHLGGQATPFAVKSFQTLDPTDGVDYVSSMLIRYQNGKQAVLTCANWCDSEGPYLTLEGTKGKVQMWSANPACPKKFRVTFKDPQKADIEYEDESGYKGFIYEANAVAEDVSKGRLENLIMPHDETLLVMKVMDQIRAENGLVYPDVE